MVLSGSVYQSTDMTEMTNSFQIAHPSPSALEAEPHAAVRADDAAGCPGCFRQAEHAHYARYLFAVSRPSSNRYIIISLVTFQLFPRCGQRSAL